MEPQPVPNYLLANRKRLGLSQSEVAFLLDGGNGEKVCRQERFAREPSLDDAIRYEIIYKRSISELFPGKYRQLEYEIAAQAKLLIDSTPSFNHNQRSEKKRLVISGLCKKKCK